MVKKAAKPKKYPVVPLKSSFMVTSIVGFLISVYYVMSISKTWGFTFALFFAMMLVASLISMTLAPVADKPSKK